MRFIRRLRKKTTTNTVTAIDVKKATDMLIESVQQKYYGDIKAKLKNKTKHNHPPIIHQLGLYLDDNKMRIVLEICIGDIKAKLKNKTKHNHPPIIHQLGLYLDDNKMRIVLKI